MLSDAMNRIHPRSPSQYLQNPNHLVAFSKIMAQLPWAHQDPSTLPSCACHPHDHDLGVASHRKKHKATARCAGKDRDGHSALGDAKCEAPFSISCAISCGVGTVRDSYN